MTVLRVHIRKINISGGILLMVIGLLMISGLWETLVASIQNLVGGVVLPL